MNEQSIQNIFIEFSIVQKSKTVNLIQELDILIARHKKIFLWSKIVTPDLMKRYCESVKIPTPPDEYNNHIKARALRGKRKTYEDISKELGISIKKVSYFISTDPIKVWTLSDWIHDYLPKDSAYYPKVDLAIDNNSNLVKRFNIGGMEAVYVEMI